MLRRKLANKQIFIYAAVDVVATLLAWSTAYYIRFNLMDNSQIGLLRRFLKYSFLLAGLVVVYASENHLYEQRRYFPWYKEFLLIIKMQLSALATLIILIYFFQPYRLSRITIGLYAGLGPLMAIFTRAILRSIMIRARLHGFNLRHVVVIGSGKTLNTYVELLLANPERGIRFTGWVSDNKEPEKYNIPRLTMDTIPHEGQTAPDSVIFGYNTSSHYKLDEFLKIFNKTPIHTLVVPDIENAFIGYTIEEFHGFPMLSINASKMNSVQAFFKRFIDLIGSITGLVVLSPLFLIVAILIKTSSKGPVFFSQRRMTRDGDIFNIWKFRSMYTESGNKKIQWTTKDDTRCTPIGKIIRSLSIDELPQLWNVLKGEMSLVGPRPERPEFIDKFKHDIPEYMLRHRMKSGITGWAQVNGWRGNTSLVDRIECDLYYIRNWSLVLDMKILLLTVIKGIIHENAY